jgi:hypothetical protein
MKDHIYETMLDLGVLGEQKAEVFFDWSEPLPSNDRFEVPENGGATVVAVIVWLDGKEVDLYEYLNGDLISDLEYECAEAYNG